MCVCVYMYCACVCISPLHDPMGACIQIWLSCFASFVPLSRCECVCLPVNTCMCFILYILACVCMCVCARRMFICIPYLCVLCVLCECRHLAPAKTRLLSVHPLCPALCSAAPDIWLLLRTMLDRQSLDNRWDTLRMASDAGGGFERASKSALACRLSKPLRRPQLCTRCNVLIIACRNA